MNFTICIIVLAVCAIVAEAQVAVSMSRADCKLLALRPSWTGIKSCKKLPRCPTLAFTASGPLPPLLCNAKGRVTYLNLHSKKKGGRLTGTLPAAWSGLTALQSLNLSRNAITGGLPKSWAALTTLRYLHLGGNKLTGGLPPSWSKMKALQFVVLGRNQLKGKLPASWSALPVLFLDLSFNKLSGGLPGAWNGFRFINILQLNNNNLSGGLPPSWGYSQQLGFVRLQGNRKLGGTVPRQWAAWTDLKEIDMRGTGIKGPIAGRLSTKAALITLHVSTSQQLCGSIPGNVIIQQRSGAATADPKRVKKLNRCK